MLTGSRFEKTCARIETALTGTFRPDLVADLAVSNGFRRALLRLRDALRADVLATRDRRVNLSEMVAECDRRTRQEGFHVLHDWDGKADRVNPDTIAVDVLNFVADQRGDDPPDRRALAILLDYYFMYLLSLLSLRLWDEGDADANLDRLNHLLAELQGPNGSGQLFAADAETLMLIATAHYELDERGFDLLLGKVRTLSWPHQVRIALGHAASMGCHLRFGFQATYGRDTVVMRDDNVADYPWLCYALATLMREYARLDAGESGEIHREAIVEALLNGLSADARAFVGEPPPSLASFEWERAGFRDLFLRYRRDLVGQFERHRPSEPAYSPLSFFFNFSHNVIKGMVVDAVLRGEPWPLTLNALLTSRPPANGERKTQLATTLMAYARTHPDRIRGRLMPVIVYDPVAGRQAYSIAMQKLRQ